MKAMVTWRALRRWMMPVSLPLSVANRSVSTRRVGVRLEEAEP
ncbi:hypothetical protein HMPREF9946_03945 [Acetobacteraceae bacterium AT-5844]|nr:hypothetical protein HMPREF9946_03945 [Acetobacteraceae bacterium AT-5844]